MKRVPRLTLPQDVFTGKCAMLVKKKRNGKHKARCVYNGRNQRYKITTHRCSPILKAESLSVVLTLGRLKIHTWLKVALAIAASRDFDFNLLDVSRAFLYTDIPPSTELFYEIPDGHPLQHENKKMVMKICKVLYGLIENHKLYHDNVTANLRSLRVLQAKFDECVYYKQNLILLLDVGDVLMLGNKNEISKFIKSFHNFYPCTVGNLSESVDFLGVNISENSKGDFEIDQAKYINGLLKKFKHLVATPKDTPLPDTFKPLVDPEHKSNTKLPYRQILGSPIYLRLTRLDLLFALHALSRFTQNVTEEAIKAIKNTLGYLQQTKNLKRRFFKGTGNVQTKLIAFCDAEWAANKLNQKSVSGNLIYLGQSLVSGKSKAQSVVATSAASAELMEIHSTAKQLQGIAGLCKDLHCELDSSPVILTDSETCVNTLEKPVTAKQKHLSVQIHFLKDLVKEKKLKVF
eukprot:augustus_masked-scaffold_58-processed-gene-0.13-mRNA-1 protein AED:1.00 eAED:1.00 QI:0/0/0/0/1/1/2/0/460